MMNCYNEIIRGLREDRDLKQIEIAQMLGTSQQQYSKYESGVRELPLRLLVALANYYGVSADYLLGRTKCRESVEALNRQVTQKCTVGEVISDILSLDAKDRAEVVEYLYFRKLKSKTD